MANTTLWGCDASGEATRMQNKTKNQTVSGVLQRQLKIVGILRSQRKQNAMGREAEASYTEKVGWEQDLGK